MKKWMVEIRCSLIYIDFLQELLVMSSDVSGYDGYEGVISPSFF